MPERGPAPAFGSTRAALRFIALLVGVLALPLASSEAGALRPETVWSSVPSSRDVAWMDAMRRLVYEERGDIDIAFVGSSFLHAGIDTPYVQAQLSEHLGRAAVARTFGYTFQGDDVRYVILRDLLERRRVRMVVLSLTLPWGLPDAVPHAWAKYWFDPIRDQALVRGLPLSTQAAYYGESVLGAPRRLLSLVRSDHPPEVAIASLGAVLVAHARDGAPLPSVPPTPPPFVASQLVHDWDEAGTVDVRSDATPAFERRMLELVAELAREHHVALVVLNVPYWPRAVEIVEAIDPREMLGPVPLVGIPAARLFAGLSDAEVASLYFDRGEMCEGHFDAVGSRFFTTAMMPAFLEIYDGLARPD